MSKMNYRRKDWKIKVRVPPMLKPNKVIDPDSLYDRPRDKEQWRRIVREYEETGVINEDV